jgi:23S rRNA (cytidine1920-2'-O)/16S rRNA (cytidine1409-2'-O)-methyltransferase
VAKDRIDSLLALRGLAESREKAKVLVMAGCVFVNGERVDRPDRRFGDEALVEVKAGGLPYVGYGGVKLEKAAEAFGIDAGGKTAIDIGSSTGGFVDFLLKSGARRVYAIDAGTHQLHHSLRQDERVVVRENTNARYLTFEDIGEHADIITVDVSFISLKKIIPALVPLLKEDGRLLALIKPQFEVGRYEVGKGGIVKDGDKIEQVIADIGSFGEELGLHKVALVEAPRDKERKNREYFILWVR